MVQEVQMPTFETPNLTAGDKAAEVFGNSNAANTKRKEADYKNQANLYKWKMENQDVMKINGLTKAGINPMIAYSQNAGIANQGIESSDGRSYTKTKQSGIKELLGFIEKIGEKVLDLKLISKLIGG